MNPKITLTTLADEIGVSRSAISKNIKKMKEQEIITRIGTDRNGYWKIN